MIPSLMTLASVLLPPLAFALGAWALWVFFLAVMCLQGARDAKKLTPWNTRIGYSVLFVGWVLDFIVQVTVAVLLFAELPRELTVSGRVKRLIGSGDGWRKAVAIWLRDHFLKPFDPTGRHG